MKSNRHWQITSKLIAGGVQTLSKAPDKQVEGVYPIYLESADGCYVYDKEGDRYIDYPLGLGAILLGHNATIDAIEGQLTRGILYSLPSYCETELAIKINKLIPCAEKMRFLKTGSEACSAAIKIARSYTKRDRIVCCGYHGWHDWYAVTTPKDKGIPEQYKLFTDKIDYGDFEALKKLIETEEFAAIILEPYIYTPNIKFLQDAVNLCHKHGSLVIFDEVVTGFRSLKGSAQKMFNIIPDIACFGKALGNGMPIAIVCGKRKYMDELEGDCFVSSTFGGELLSIASALQVLETIEKEKVIENIWAAGTLLKNTYNDLAINHGIESKCEGLPCRTMFTFPTSEHKSLFWQECIKRGVLFGYAQFISFAHTRYIIEDTLDVINEALKIVANNWNNPLNALEGKPAKEVFRLICTRENK